MRVVTSAQELAEELAKVDQAGAISDAARRQQFQTFEMALPDDFPADPESDAYRDRQFSLYAEIAGRPYAISNERTLFDVTTMADKPFPYLNEGWEVTGDQLIAIGWLFKAMKLPAGASILEFGPGWGNTTLALAQNGHRVSAIEIEPNFVELISERARRLNLTIEVIQGDFLDAARLNRSFDAVLFFESFHHCADHARLLDLLQNLLSADGIAVFCAEPVDESFKYPWSLRLDGQSLWAIRANGWLELGFTETYFIRQLMLRGFVVEKLVSNASPLANCLVASRARGRYVMASFYMPPAEDRTWGQAESDLALCERFTSEESTITLERGGSYAEIQIALRNFAPINLPVETTFGSVSRTQVVTAHSTQMLSMPYDGAGTVLTIRTKTWRPIDYPGMSRDSRSLGISVSTIRLV